MKEVHYNVIGIMSGTSLDGVDLAHIKFKIQEGNWSFELFECETVAYDLDWINRLKLAVNFEKTELEILDKEYTRLLSKIILEFIEKYQIEKIDAVCSHGHTILHQPKKGFTLQIGNLPEIAALIQQKVVCNFRVQDVDLGGQGAPLVPIGDQILFSEYDYCLNLGGFSNVSFVANKQRIAFDISPVNTVLNYYANKLGFDYDDKGEMSRTGNCNFVVLDALNKLHFYKEKHPKSLGFEFVKEIILPTIEPFHLTATDALCTFTEHVAFQMALALPNKKGRMLITGGGAYNDFLIERINFYLPEIEIIIPNKKILEFKEALIFALLGVLKLRAEINVLSSVTGAKKDHSAGIIYVP